MHLTRRGFVQSAIAVSLGFRGLKTLFADAALPAGEAPGAGGFGPLLPDPNRILDLPKGFSYTIISRVGDRMDDGFFVPGQPDAMAAFAGADGKVILIRNHEIKYDDLKKSPFGPKNELLGKLPPESLYDFGRGKTPALGGTTTLLYDPTSRRIERQYLSLAGTENNCAGGPTPWGTWVTCEETMAHIDAEHEKDHGYAFEVPAVLDGKLAAPRPLRDMGRFRHEAVAVDPKSGVVYQTEDILDGLFYRFIPNKPGDLHAGGRLQALVARDSKSLDTRNWSVEQGGLPTAPRIAPGTKFAVAWIDLDDIQSPKDDLRTRGFAKGAAMFARAEGIWYGHDSLYFACTNGGRTQTGQIWRYQPSPAEETAGEEQRPGTLELFLEPNDASLLENADNLTISRWGDLVICEDAPKENDLVCVTPRGEIHRFARNVADNSEFAGAVFSPDGNTLFVNMQSTGLTLAITGPWPSAKAG